MEVGLGNTLLAGDPRLVDHIVGEVKSQGIFDQFRKECIADVDTKPAYQNLRARVEGSVNSFLSKQTWKPDLNKNQLRENLRKHIHEAAYLDAGVERIVDQVVNPKVYSVFMPQIEDVVYKFLGLEKPKGLERNGAHGLRDLLPKDLDPVSPESDKNSLKDVSLESVDANTDENSVTNEEKLSKANFNNEQRAQSDDNNIEKSKDDHYDNDQPDTEKNQLEFNEKLLNKSVVCNLNITSKSDDKMEDEEEDSPMFEPIDIMNLNESNVSNDSHLSGISELSSHRSRSPTFSNDFSKDHMDFSNADSQLSKVSSDSRLSIVTDFGLSNLSNHASTPMLEISKDDSNKGKSKDSSDYKYPKDNFKVVREFESSKNNTKDTKSTLDPTTSKDNVQEIKDNKDSKNSKNSLPSKDSSRDATEIEVKEKSDSRDSKDKNKDGDSSKVKSIKDKPDARDSKSNKDRDKDHKKRQNSHSSSRNEKNDKYQKDRSKERSDKLREGGEKHRESLDKSKENSDKSKEDKSKDSDRKGNAGKESKDLKDIYKEKIRELREKKELTEKEKLHKDNKESKLSKESKDKKDRKDYKKEHKTSSSKNNSRYDEKTSKGEEKCITKTEAGKFFSKGSDLKDSKSDPKDSKCEPRDSKNDPKDAKGEPKDAKGEPKDSKGELKDSKGEPKDKKKRDDRRHSKENKNRSHSTTKSDSSDKNEKSDAKRDLKSDSHSKDSERNDKFDNKKESKTDCQRSDSKKDSKTDSQSKYSEKPERSESKKDSKTDSQGKDRKRKGDKKSKTKDDHSSLRKNPNDRRSTDRDGSNGSNGKSSQKSSASSTTCSSSVVSSNLTKESSGTSNSSSETSDSIEGSQSDELKSSPSEPTIDSNLDKSAVIEASTPEILNENALDFELCITSEFSPKKVELGQTEFSLPLKKRPLLPECTAPSPSDFKVKKPKFAKNFYEAKKLIKIRKRLEKQRLREYEAAKERFRILNAETGVNSQPTTENDKNSVIVVDEDRVQIIEIPDDEYDQPYPEKSTGLPLGELSIACLNNQLAVTSVVQSEENPERQSKLSEMESSIRQSLEEMISDKKLAETNCPTENTENPVDSRPISHAETETIVVPNNNTQNEEPDSTSILLKNENATESMDAIQRIIGNSSIPANSKSTASAAASQDQGTDEPTLDNEKSRDRSKENKQIHESSTKNETSSDSRIENSETELDAKESKFNEDLATVNMVSVQNPDVTIPSKDTQGPECEVSQATKLKESKKLKTSKINALIPKVFKSTEPTEIIGNENAALSDRCMAATVTPLENPNISPEETSKCEVSHTTKSKESKQLKPLRKNARIPKVSKTAEPTETIDTEDAVLSERRKGAIVVPSKNPDIPLSSEVMQASKCDVTEPTKVKDSKKLKTLKKNSLIPKVPKSTKPAEEIDIENAALSDRFISATESSNQRGSSPMGDNEMSMGVIMTLADDLADCLYLEADNEESSRFSKFLEAFEIEEGKNLEVIIESLGGQMVQPLSKPMAPPLPKRKLSTSPLTDILLSNSNNNNDGLKIIASLNDEGVKVIKKRKLGRPKKQRDNANVCASHNLPNGENFVMPLSPESDVSATSEKTTLHTIKEEKSRQRSNQRYSSDDLYKPRPFFSSSSRRSRRSTQA